MQRLIHNLGSNGIGRPAMEEPRHEELHERRIGIELEIIEAREFIPGLMQGQSAVGLSGEAQHFGRKTVEQSTHPAPIRSVGAAAGTDPALRQQCLYFLPLPQGQGSLRPSFICRFRELLSRITETST